jgi:hypothetical protein
MIDGCVYVDEQEYIFGVIDRRTFMRTVECVSEKVRVYDRTIGGNCDLRLFVIFLFWQVCRLQLVTEVSALLSVYVIVVGLLEYCHQTQ